MCGLPALSGGLQKLVTDTFELAGIAVPDQRIVTSAVDALVGLAAFPAEQVLATSLSRKGLDIERLWVRKRQAVEQPLGLSV